MSWVKRSYIAASIALALVAAPQFGQTAAPPAAGGVAGFTGNAADTVSDTVSGQSDSTVDIIPDKSDNPVNAASGEYDISAPYDGAQNAPPVQSESMPARYDDNNANIPPVQPEPPESGGLEINVPRSQEELGRMSREELYRLAFGKAAPERPRSLVMRLFVEGRAFGNTEIVYDAGFASFDFSSPPLSGYLDTILLPEARGAAGDSTGVFNSAALAGAGYVISVNDRTYEMHVTVPPDSKFLQRLNLGGGYVRTPSGLEVKPSAVSFYANYRVDERLSWSWYRYDGGYSGYRYGEGQGQRDPASVDLDGALNVYGWVLESSARLREAYKGYDFTGGNFSRGDIRLVRDIVPRRVRVTAGDINMSSDLLSQGEMAGGLRIEYNDWFFGGEPSDARSKVTFFMPRAGEVELFMDGRFQRRFYLHAGNHEISGFGGNVGRNMVRLVLRMEDGGVEEVPFEYVLGDPRNMLVGESRYTLAAGVRRVYAPAPMTYDYDPKEPAAGADILYGLLPFLSAGAAAQASQANALAAAQFLLNMGAAGWMNVRAYANTPVDNGRGGIRADANWTADIGAMAKALGNRLWGGGRMPNMSLSLRGYWLSERYSQNLFAQSGVNADMAGVSGDFGFGVLKGSVSASGGASFKRKLQDTAGYPPVDYNYGLRASQSVKRVTFSANAGVAVQGGVHRPYLSAYTNYSLGARIGRHQFSASGDMSMRGDYVETSAREVYDPGSGEYRYDTVPAYSDYRMTGGANAGWRWSNGSSGNYAQSYAASVSMRDRFGVPNVGASANNSFNRAQFWLDYGMTDYTAAGYDRMTHTMRAALSGSLMFADGLWALGRPTNGSFLLADTRDNLKSAAVHINRSRVNRRDYSRNGWFGAAYQNYLMSYRPTEVTVTLSDVPPGALLENNTYHAAGAYKQGYALRLGSKPSVIILVRFIDNGEPLKYAYASIEPEDGGGEDEKRATFTGGDGYLQMGNLTPGVSYRITFSSLTYIKNIFIDIPKDADPIMELPDIVVERE